jgi:hypothetical protein
MLDYCTIVTMMAVKPLAHPPALVGHLVLALDDLRYAGMVHRYTRLPRPVSNPRALIFFAWNQYIFYFLLASSRSCMSVTVAFGFELALAFAFPSVNWVETSIFTAPCRSSSAIRCFFMRSDTRHRLKYLT